MREHISYLKTKLPNGHISIAACSFIIVSIVILFLLQPSRGQNSPIEDMKQRALRAEYSGNIKVASALYLQALALSRQTHSKIDQLEIISRLVRERISQGRLDQVDSYVEEAEKVFESAKGTSEFDTVMSVWMTDLADGFWTHGERTTNQQVKELCCEKYVEIEFLTCDSLNQQLCGRANVLSTCLINHGRYHEAASLTEKIVAHLRRFYHDNSAIGQNIHVLGSIYLLGGDYKNASDRLQQATALTSENGEPSPATTRLFSLIAYETTHDLGRAASLCRHALNLDLPTAPHDLALAQDKILLAFFSEAGGRSSEAKELLSDALKVSQAIPPRCFPGWPDSDMTDAAKVVALDQLSHVCLKLNEKQNVAKYDKAAAIIRQKHPGWQSCHNPDPFRFYLISGHLPFELEVIKTLALANYN